MGFLGDTLGDKLIPLLVLALFAGAFLLNKGGGKGGHGGGSSSSSQSNTNSGAQ